MQSLKANKVQPDFQRALGFLLLLRMDIQGQNRMVLVRSITDQYH